MIASVAFLIATSAVETTSSPGLTDRVRVLEQKGGWTYLSIGPRPGTFVQDDHSARTIDVHDVNGRRLESTPYNAGESFVGIAKGGALLFEKDSLRREGEADSRVMTPAPLRLQHGVSIRYARQGWLLNEDSEAPIFLGCNDPRGNLQGSQRILILPDLSRFVVTNFRRDHPLFSFYDLKDGSLMKRFEPFIADGLETFPIRALFLLPEIAVTGKHVWFFGDYDKNVGERFPETAQYPRRMSGTYSTIALYRGDLESGRSKPILFLHEQPHPNAGTVDFSPRDRGLVAVDDNHVALTWSVNFYGDTKTLIVSSEGL